jgi:hypothetical protein
MYDKAHSKLIKYVAININLSNRTPTHQAKATLDRDSRYHSSDSNPSSTIAIVWDVSDSSREIRTVQETGV